MRNGPPYTVTNIRLTRTQLQFARSCASAHQMTLAQFLRDLLATYTQYLKITGRKPTKITLYQDAAEEPIWQLPLPPRRANEGTSP
jgi:hypothetical protein